jgi:glutathione S-transferase
MRLHYHPLSSYSQKVVIGIALRGDAVERRELDPFKGDLRTTEYLAMNPFAKMPVLETDDDGPIFESTSILEYLEERGPRRLLPVGQERRARHLDRLGDLYLLNPIGEFFWKKTDEVQAKATTTMAKGWGVWERELADGRPFLCGAEITLPDLGAAVASHFAVTEGITPPDAILRYRDRLLANPAVAAAEAASDPFVEATKPRRVKS